MVGTTVNGRSSDDEVGDVDLREVYLRASELSRK